MAAGNVHTTQILQLSGIGPPEVLQQFGIPIALALPGVGNNFQDHAYVGAVYPCMSALFDHNCNPRHADCEDNNYSYFTSISLDNNPDLQELVAEEYHFNKTGKLLLT